MKRRYKLQGERRPLVCCWRYASHKVDNVFNRLGGNKCHRSPTRPGGHERWQAKLYDQQPYFAMKSAYRGSTPPMYQQFARWGFNPRVPYSRGPATYHQPDWIPVETYVQTKIAREKGSVQSESNFT
jgi:hypothetical protein